VAANGRMKIEAAGLVPDNIAHVFCYCVSPVLSPIIETIKEEFYKERKKALTLVLALSCVILEMYAGALGTSPSDFYLDRNDPSRVFTHFLDRLPDKDDYFTWSRLLASLDLSGGAEQEREDKCWLKPHRFNSY